MTWRDVILAGLVATWVWLWVFQPWPGQRSVPQWYQSGTSSLTEAEWNEQYDEAMQWRDWQTCDYLLEERERCAWYEPESFGVGETSCGDAATNRSTITDAGDLGGAA